MSAVYEIENALHQAGTKFTSEKSDFKMSEKDVFGDDITIIRADGNVFICADINPVSVVKNALSMGEPGYGKLKRHVQHLMMSARTERDMLLPVVVLSVPDNTGEYNNEELEHGCHNLEQNLNVLTFVRKPGETNFIERMPSLFPMEFAEVPASFFVQMLTAEATSGFSGAVIEFTHCGPGIAVISGGNGTGKTVMSRSFPDFSDNENFDDTVMRTWRKAVGYGYNGNLQMPLIYEGNGIQCLERLGEKVMRCATSSSQAVLILDTPFTGISELYSLKAMDIVARLSLFRQVVVTSRNYGEANYLTKLASAYGAGVGTADLNAGAVSVTVSPKQEIVSPKL